MFAKNYHTHTYRCKHATGDVEDYCRAALEQGMTVLGISDHTPLPDGRWASVRMSMDELPGYCGALDAAAEAYPDLQLLRGMECEYVEEFVPFYRDVLLGEWGLHYLVGGAHWYPFAGEWVGLYGTEMDAAMLRAYTEYLVASMRSGLYAFIAHPDLFGVCCMQWNRHTEEAASTICRTAAELDLPLEINAYGYRKPYMESAEGLRPKYPWRPFWQVAAAWKTPVIVNSDAHRPEDVLACVDTCHELAADVGLCPVDLSDIEQVAVSG